MLLLDAMTLGIAAGDWSFVGLDWLWSGALKVTVVAVCAVLIALAARPAAARVRYLMWSGTLVAVLAIPILSAVLPRFTVGGVPSWSVEALLATEPLRPPIAPSAIDRPPVRTRPENLPDSVSVMASPTIGATAPPADVPSTAAFPWPAVLFGVWLAGAAWIVVRHLVAIAEAERIARRAANLDDVAWTDLLAACRRTLRIDRAIELRVSPEIPFPVTWRVMRPLILVPASAAQWDTDRRRIVLLHELVHVKRRDWLFQVLGRICLAVFWFHPLVWYAVHRQAIEREMACDESVLALGTRPTDYATHLLQVARAASPGPRPAIGLTMAAQSRLETRMRGILRGRRSYRGIAAAPMVGVVCGLALTVAPLAPSLNPPWRPVERIGPDERRLGLMLLRTGEWREAADYYTRMLAMDPSDGECWFRLAYARHRLGDVEAALAADQRAARDPRFRALALYNAACGHTLLEDHDTAIDALRQSVACGFYVPLDQILADSDLKPLHNDPRFVDLMRNLQPPRAQYEALARTEAHDAIIMLWRMQPHHPIDIIRSYLEEALTLQELFGGLAQVDTEGAAAIADLHNAAKTAADLADQAAGHTRFSAYARAVIGWTDDDRARYRKAQARRRAARRWGRDDSRTRTQIEDSVRTAEQLGDAFGLVVALCDAGALALQDNRPVEAWQLLMRGGRLADQLGMLRYRAYADDAIVRTYGAEEGLRDAPVAD